MAILPALFGAYVGAFAFLFCLAPAPSPSRSPQTCTKGKMRLYGNSSSAFRRPTGCGSVSRCDTMSRT